MSRINKSQAAPLALPSRQEQPEAADGLPCWAVIELYGHQRIVGAVTADPVELPGMVRVDVPDLTKDGAIVSKGHTRYLGKGAIYAFNPCDEQTVRSLLPHVDGLPARPMSLREDW